MSEADSTRTLLRACYALHDELEAGLRTLQRTSLTGKLSAAHGQVLAGMLAGVWETHDDLERLIIGVEAGAPPALVAALHEESV